jgi:hypothetical protein
MRTNIGLGIVPDAGPSNLLKTLLPVTDQQSEKWR